MDLKLKEILDLIRNERESAVSELLKAPRVAPGIGENRQKSEKSCIHGVFLSGALRLLFFQKRWEKHPFPLPLQDRGENFRRNFPTGD